MKKIVLLGASGSIGTQTLDVVAQHSDLLECLAISVGTNISCLKEILHKTPFKLVCVQHESDAISLRNQFDHIRFVSGDAGLLELATLPAADLLVNALVGFVGLIPTLAAIKAHKDIALANKETLVVAGELVMAECKKNNVKLYPIDSEHSAIFQCLQGNDRKSIKRLVITASGGSFRDRTREELSEVTIKEALSHPNWTMGAKITIDSATMVNKGFEVIEAHWLFDLPYEKIDVILHKESVIHSMVEYVDSSVIAQMASPDMRLPIQYALLYPDRYAINGAVSLDFTQLSQLHFTEVSTIRFPLLKLVIQAGITGGTMPAVVNAANEVAVAAFLKGKIRFLDIETVLQKTVDRSIIRPIISVNDCLEADASARIIAADIIQGG